MLSAAPAAASRPDKVEIGIWSGRSLHTGTESNCVSDWLQGDQARQGRWFARAAGTHAGMGRMMNECFPYVHRGSPRAEARLPLLYPPRVGKTTLVAPTGPQNRKEKWEKSFSQ